MNRQQWDIQARAFLIPYTPFSHNFWVLTNSAHRVTDQIHGLAFHIETKTTKAIGSSADRLQVFRDAGIPWSLQPNQPTKSCIIGDEEEVKERWQAAVNAIPAINALQLRYPNLWEHFHKKNCNSVFNTLGQIMGIDAPSLLLPTWAPGIHLIISQDIINQYCYKQW
ncbi:MULTISPECIES: hypothetical protein [Pelosinus]|jgi:hypothetical protein|uniref:Uncharacterized protein n=1 Tax=Pelosinus fermentans B4 TaxID=1149862 RepID=I9L550_9FIRM|nr:MULTISPECIES: hypothetical protein [Pelosinus]EIW15489.1 hypothetical protein FB4_1178 [Pelosinus fermentans B4]EIW26820.1 hypothetical protein FA11_1824 [Pelosinus fermentans A11]OAM92231.1 hypothetical protein FR7_00247 [Pelosinus fermentans DSM 17108]SDQ37702.1 hypothetical protein SAMN04515679_0291 [Pelosinus fermentans]